MSKELELEHLRAFQRALQPAPRSGCSFASVQAVFQPAGGPVSGDFHDLIPLEDGRQVVLVGDVTGHGMSSALVMAVIHGALREAFRWTSTPCVAMNGLHSLLADLGSRAGGPRLFSATLFIGVVDEQGEMKYVNAGHPPPVILRNGQVHRELEVHVPPLGLVAPERCMSVEAQFEVGDRLVLHTDGLHPPDVPASEAMTRIRALAGESTEQLIEVLMSGAGADDDRTVAVMEYTGPCA